MKEEGGLISQNVHKTTGILFIMLGSGKSSSQHPK